MAQVARRFVRQALSYDSCAADREGFPQQVADLATKGELRRLRASARAHLRWWVLCQRKERAEVHIDGVGQEPASGDIQVVRVEALRATRSDISTVRDFIHITLALAKTPGGWRVAGAEGGGL